MAGAWPVTLCPCPILGTTPNHGYPSYGTNPAPWSQLMNLARATFAQNTQFCPQPRSACSRRHTDRSGRSPVGGPAAWGEGCAQLWEVDAWLWEVRA
jgi:hypothetical protein